MAGAAPPPACAIPVPARRRANVGLVLGLVAGLGLGLAGVTGGVDSEAGDGSGVRFRVRVLGVVAHRYPEDGDLYPMRPYPQALHAREHLTTTSALAGGLLGWVVGYGSGRRATAPAGFEDKDSVTRS
ncbi:hypothetical protein J0H58_15190 [bacterium]|nr:hypothetical protein [bacterium]